MGIRKVGKMYWLDVRIRGKRYRRSLQTTRKYVAYDRYQNVLKSLLAEHEGGRVRFSDFSKRYLEWAWETKPTSALREQQRLKIIQDAFTDNITYLDEITHFHIEGLRRRLKKRNLSQTTINHYLQLLRGMFYRAIEWGVYNKENPLKKVKFYRIESPRRALTDPELRKVLEACQEIQANPKSLLQKLFYDMVVLALNTGLRKGEVLNLRWKDVKGEGELRIIGKGEKARSIPLNKAAKEIIQRQPRRTEYVFHVPNRNQPDLFRRTVDRAKKLSGVEFTFHTLRHTFSTQLIGKGIDFVTLGSLLGHSKIMTSLIYSHTDESRKRQAVESLE